MYCVSWLFYFVLFVLLCVFNVTYLRRGALNRVNAFIRFNCRQVCGHILLIVDMGGDMI